MSRNQDGSNGIVWLGIVIVLVIGFWIYFHQTHVPASQDATLNPFEKAADKASDKAREMGKDAGKALKEQMDAAGKAANAGMDKAKVAAGNAMDAAGEKLQQAGKDMKDSVNKDMPVSGTQDETKPDGN